MNENGKETFEVHHETPDDAGNKIVPEANGEGDKEN